MYVKELCVTMLYKIGLCVKEFCVTMLCVKSRVCDKVCVCVSKCVCGEEKKE